MWADISRFASITSPRAMTDQLSEHRLGMSAYLDEKLAVMGVLAKLSVF